MINYILVSSCFCDVNHITLPVFLKLFHSNNDIARVYTVCRLYLMLDANHESTSNSL